MILSLRIATEEPGCRNESCLCQFRMDQRLEPHPAKLPVVAAMAEIECQMPAAGVCAVPRRFPPTPLNESEVRNSHAICHDRY